MQLLDKKEKTNRMRLWGNSIDSTDAYRARRCYTAGIRRCKVLFLPQHRHENALRAISYGDMDLVLMNVVAIFEEIYS
ncbi:hypothetical protein N7453_008759 [Penicillium expansum]|nr:hypothetical protein N7453_008759 [Penicillium expansum]